MRSKLILALIALLVIIATGLTASWWLLSPGRPKQPQSQPVAAAQPEQPAPPAKPIEPAASARQELPAIPRNAAAQRPVEQLPTPLSKAERLAQIRETYRALATGDAKTALRAARKLTDDTERETALLALVTEWTRGELEPPQRRAWAIANYGLEAGLGMELAHNPDLAVLWANELTDGQARAAVLERTAVAMLGTDPANAIALSQSFQAGDYSIFSSVFANWAQQDTDAALQYADQLPDATDRESAMRAIQSVAPVGIGTELRMQDGLPVINRLLPGTPAETGGQLQPGDRIVAMAQGNNSFVDAHGMALADVVQAIRGTPGTLLQLKVLSADAPPDAAPRTVAITRDQIKFKR
jgi:hypothetical protein